MTIDFDAFEEMEFPQYRDIVYVFYYVRGEGTELVPFYVGESSRHFGRFGDYMSGKFSATTDFKVGEAVKYLRKRRLRVVVKFKESSNRRDERKAEEKRILQHLSSTFRLLNDLQGYRYRSADENGERRKINQFIDDILRNPKRIEPIAPARRKRASGIVGTSSVRSPHQASAQLDDNMATKIHGTVRKVGTYADGTPRLEIHIPRNRAEGLPFHVGDRVQITLRFDGIEYDAGLRATERNDYVWVSPDLRSVNGTPTKLGRVLTEGGLRPNDPLILVVEDHLVSVETDHTVP